MEKGIQSGQPSTSNEKTLIDRDCEIFETVLSHFDPYELINLVCDRFRDFHDYLHIWELNLGKFIIPQTYYFPKFVSWCEKNYLSEKRFVVSENGPIVFYINVDSITKMLYLLENLLLQKYSPADR
jgi:hypothetical protein